MSDLLWFVAHTRPRCEKKLVQYCDREKLATTLPCYNAIHEYRGKTAVFRNPLFPGYVFLQLSADQQQKVVQNNYVANLFEVDNQDLFVRQLEAVLRALATDLEICLASEIGEATRVRVVRGPLQGIEGLVDQRYGMSTLLLRVDFIGQAAAVRMEAGDLEFASSLQ